MLLLVLELELELELELFPPVAVAFPPWPPVAEADELPPCPPVALEELLPELETLAPPPDCDTLMPATFW